MQRFIRIHYLYRKKKIYVLSECSPMSSRFVLLSLFEMHENAQQIRGKFMFVWKATEWTNFKSVSHLFVFICFFQNQWKLPSFVRDSNQISKWIGNQKWKYLKNKLRNWHILPHYNFRRNIQIKHKIFLPGNKHLITTHVTAWVSLVQKKFWFNAILCKMTIFNKFCFSLFLQYMYSELIIINRWLNER